MSKIGPILLSGLLLRIFIFAYFPGVSSTLDAQAEVATPISSYKRLQDGLFHYTHSSSAYNGICYQSPLLLALFSTVGNKFVVDFIYGFVDTVTAAALAGVASRVNRHVAGSSSDNWIVAAVYLFNPYTLMSTVARSTNIFSNAAVVGALLASTSKRPFQSVSLLALASVLSLYPAYLIPPFLLICREYSPRGSIVTQLTILSGFFVLSTAVYLGLSYLVTNSWDFIDATYGTIWYLKELSPNIGLWWYLFAEMFDYFRPFFIGVFQLYILIFSFPITIRFRHYPLFALTVLWCISTVFRPYPEVGDMGFYFSLLALNKPVLGLLKYPLVTFLTLLYSCILGPTFYHLWIYLGSGNANFFFAITLVYALGLSVHVSDVIWSAIRYEYDGGKNQNLRQI